MSDYNDPIQSIDNILRTFLDCCCLFSLCSFVVTMFNALIRSRSRPVSLLLRCLTFEALGVRSYVGTDQEVLEYFEVGLARYFVCE